MAEALKLLIVVPWVSRRGGGVAEAARLQAKLLSQRGGIAVEVVSLREPDGAAMLDDWGSAQVSTYPYWGSDTYRFSPGLFRHIVRSDAQLVHVHGIWSFQCLAVLVWSLFGGWPYVVSPHGMLEAWVLARSRRMKGLVGWLYQRWFLRRAAALQVLTETERVDVAPYTGAGEVAVIPNFVELPDREVTPPAWVDDDVGRRTIYLYFGRIHDKKGWRELCAAWDAMSRLSIPFRFGSQLVFCGWPDDAPDFEAVIDDLRRRHGNVLFAGPQSGAARQAALEAAEVLVLPSHSEGLPMAVLEAWAVGTPAMMTAACNLPVGFSRSAAMEIGTGPDDIAAGLERYFELTQAERQAMGEAGRALVEEEFSPEPTLRRLLALYDRIVQRKAKSIAVAEAGE